MSTETKGMVVTETKAVVTTLTAAKTAVNIIQERVRQKRQPVENRFGHVDYASGAYLEFKYMELGYPSDADPMVMVKEITDELTIQAKTLRPIGHYRVHKKQPNPPEDETPMPADYTERLVVRWSDTCKLQKHWTVYDWQRRGGECGVCKKAISKDELTWGEHYDCVVIGCEQRKWANSCASHAPVADVSFIVD